MVENSLISVIIPIYNVEAYLKRCVDSVINQTYKNLEIILVDDGSPDNCPQICDDYAKQDSRVKVVHKENGGLSDARNAGLKIAKGEYISFIDSDDWINLEMFKRMVEVAIDKNADIVECNVYNAYDSYIEKYNTDQYDEYIDNYSIIEAYIKDYKIKTVVWNKIYKKELLNGIEFALGKYNEDEFFTYQVLAKARSYVHLEDYYYNYYQREGSIMGSSFSLKKLDSLEGAVNRAMYIKENYPNLYFYPLKTTTMLCIFLYQNLLKNKSIDKDKVGRNRVKKYRKMLKWSVSDLKRAGGSISVYVIISGVSLWLCASLRNLFRIGAWINGIFVIKKNFYKNGYNFKGF